MAAAVGKASLPPNLERPSLYRVFGQFVLPATLTFLASSPTLGTPAAVSIRLRLGCSRPATGAFRFKGRLRRSGFSPSCSPIQIPHTIFVNWQGGLPFHG